MARRNWSPGPNLAADQLLRDSSTTIVAQHTSAEIQPLKETLSNQCSRERRARANSQGIKNNVRITKENNRTL